ncbi:MAG TPA: DUF805 domain-containing protein [Methyloceanibacter sp.]|nr:DUF805 domain-containing protein [Methyloceanibacter sp.]
MKPIDVDFASLFLSREGRINRSKFWIGAACFIAVWLLIELVFGASIFGRIVKLLLAIALLYPAFAVAAKRFQDRNRPGETALFGLVPVFAAILLDCFGMTGDAMGANGLGWICRLIYLGVGLWFAIELGALKGTPGPNRFGGDPLAAVY